jgi:acetyl-CoA carboxylase biotin carboxyl carrier protein
MDFKQIQELIKLVNKSNIGELTIEENGQKLTIKQKKDPAPIYAAETMPMASLPRPVAQAALPAAEVIAVSESAPAAASSSKTIVIKSPMIGTFYRKAGPSKPNFVEVGTAITTGQVVCIIEAMKLFNEIESEFKGKVVKILVEDASPVEFDQPLFEIEPA